MRGFLGCALSEAFTDELNQAACALPASSALRLVLPADYHVTIKFLSEFSSTRFFECLGELCALGPPPSHSLSAGRLALWPTVIALECEPSPALVRWHAAVNELLERRGFLKERHPRFHPHISLARRKEAERIPEIERALATAENSFRGQVVTLQAPALWRTEPDGTGRRHSPFLSPLFH